MTPSRRSVDDGIAVIGVSGEHLAWASENDAHDLVRARRATVIQRRGRIRQVQMRESVPAALLLLLLGRGTALDRTRFIHKRETETNPANCWEHARLLRDVYAYMQVLIGICQNAKA